MQSRAVRSFAFAAALASGCSLLINLDDLTRTGDGGGVDGNALDAGAFDAETGPPCDTIDGGTPCTPSRTDCFSYGTCNHGQLCCSNFGCIDSATLAPNVCVQNDGGVFECDEPADCDGGDSCCLVLLDSGNHFFGSSCGGSLGSCQAIACKSDNDCLLDHCMKTTCFGLPFQTCAGQCP